MKILVKALVGIGVICIGAGVILAGVSLITGGGIESVVNHQIATPYYDVLVENVNMITEKVNSVMSTFFFVS